MDITDLFKQAEKLKEELAQKQEELAGKLFVGESGAGMVIVTVNGRHEVVSLKIDPQMVDPKNVAMLQDLIVAAVNAALAKARDEVQGLFSKMMMPGGVGS